MNVHPISQPNMSFRTCARIYNPSNIKRFEHFGEEVVRTSTNMFREDLDWDGLVKFITNHFLFKKKVNMYSMASSDGSEAYSLGISFLQKIPFEGLKKYMPIIASDIDPEIIKTARSGRINIADFELSFFDSSKLKLRNYFTKESKALEIADDKLEINPIHSHRPIKTLKDCVKFHIGDILGEISRINDDGNSVIMCRNVFPYLSEKYTDDVVAAAKNHLKNGSIFITGSFDERVNISEKLLNNGFCQPLCDSPNIFLRMEI